MAEPDDELDGIEASMAVTEFFRQLEDCDSKRVEDFWDELNNSVLEIRNPHGWTTND